MLRLARTLELLAAAFGRLTIRYAIVGSVASSARGSYRATEDIDVVAAIGPSQVAGLCEILGVDWYADGDQIRAAIAAGRSFNLIYLPFSQKVDVFPVKDEFGSAQVEHASALQISALGDSAAYPVASAEDIVLAKLQWYRAGGEVSERQWTDILSVIRATPGLNWNYTTEWAERLGVAQLLERARLEQTA
ncbi:MAG TPA: hypothetical protein VHW09_32485 [Bryobacteraceae bacterium]|jgi:hypothetical protein|nr:hypothetical protein [Bryobacteraceae bacterium]